MSSNYTDCPELTRVLDGDQDPQHLVVCAECADLAVDLGQLRVQAASLPADGWAGQASPQIDVEAALARVLAGARPQRRRGPRRAATALRLLCTAAALLLVFSIGAPVFLRHRIEHTSSSLAPSGDAGVFWTSYGPQR